MFKTVLSAVAAILAVLVAAATPASAHTIAYKWTYYGWGWGFQPYHVHHSHGDTHAHSHSHSGGKHHSHSHGHVPGAYHVVAVDSLNVRSGPSTDHGVVHVVSKDERVLVRGCGGNNWCEVTYSGHHHGWVKATYLH